MSALQFFLNILTLCGEYISAFVTHIFTTPVFLIPASISFCIGILILVIHILRGVHI